MRHTVQSLASTEKPDEWHMPTTPVLGVRRKGHRILEACWPSSLAKSASSRFSDRGRVMKLISGLHMHTHRHVHIQAQAHTSRPFTIS